MGIEYYSRSIDTKKKKKKKKNTYSKNGMAQRRNRMFCNEFR